MKMDLYLKNNPNGSPWKLWAIAKTTSEVIVRFGPYKRTVGGEYVAPSLRSIKLKGSVDKTYQSKIDEQRADGYILIGEFDVNGDGNFSEVKKPEPAKNIKTIYATGEVAINSPDFVNLDALLNAAMLRVQSSIVSKSRGSNVTHFELIVDGYSNFSINVVETNPVGKVNFIFSDNENYSPFAALFVLMFDKYIREYKLGSLSFSDENSEEIDISTRLTDKQLNKFNIYDLPDIKQYAEILDLIPKGLNYKTGFAPDVSAVFF